MYGYDTIQNVGVGQGGKKRNKIVRKLGRVQADWSGVNDMRMQQ